MEMSSKWQKTLEDPLPDAIKQRFSTGGSNNPGLLAGLKKDNRMSGI